MRPFASRAMAFAAVALWAAASGCSRPSASATGDQPKLLAAQWIVERASMSGACHVRQDGTLPDLGVDLATKPDLKSACSDALARRSDDAADTQKCLAYTQGAKTQCAKAGVTLP